MDSFVDRTVLSQLDHSDLNRDVKELEGVVPTTENLALLIHRRLREAWDKGFGDRPIQLDRVRVEETARNSFEVTD
jgi:6-pyruvoyltetrahydropterin/6-carboxytetrahydropterin synthase